MLSIAGLSAEYGSFRALFDISLEVAAGEAVAVLGPNGAGKTTLMRVISGMLPVQSGTLAFEGASLVGLKAPRIVASGIAHVPENRRLFPRLTVEENLRMGAFLPAARAQFAERLTWVFELFPRLQERERQKAGTMSGGEQQMLAIGRALMARPRLLMLDEPSMGIAPILVERIYETIGEINRSGVAILLVEQNANYALDISRRGYVLETGRVVLLGDSAKLRDDPEVQRAYLGT